MTAAAETAVLFDTSMAELTGKTVVSEVFTVLREETASQTDAQRDDNEILHAVGRAEGIFAEG